MQYGEKSEHMLRSHDISLLRLILQNLKQKIIRLKNILYSAVPYVDV